MSVQVKPGSTEWNLRSPSSTASSSRVIKMFASLDLEIHVGTTRKCREPTLHRWSEAGTPSRC